MGRIESAQLDQRTPLLINVLAMRWAVEESEDLLQDGAAPEQISRWAGEQLAHHEIEQNMQLLSLFLQNDMLELADGQIMRSVV